MRDAARKWRRVHAAAGRAAFRAGLAETHNPHPVGSMAYSAWRRAWRHESNPRRAAAILSDPALSVDA